VSELVSENEGKDYLLTFLMILVDRAGGRLEVDGLGDYAGRLFEIEMDIRTENDTVVLTTRESKGRLGEHSDN
jgi:hypothetical protein